MSVNRYPDTLPQPSAPGFALSPVDQSLRSNMEVGAQRVRRRTFARLDKMTVELRMTELEFTAFRAWAESAAYSLAGSSDDIATWTLVKTTRSAAAAFAPDGIVVDRMLETVDNDVHRVERSMPGAAVNNASLICRATLKAVNGANARFGFLDRTGTMASVNIDLATGTLSGAVGLTSQTITDRGNGWWRVTVIGSTATGGASPILRVNALSSGMSLSYVGDVTRGLDICETQARFETGYDLFLPTGSDGKALGSGGGSSWFYMPIASGGGLTTAEARFTGPYKVTTQSALRRTVTAEVEVRNA